MTEVTKQVQDSTMASTQLATCLLNQRSLSFSSSLGIPVTSTSLALPFLHDRFPILNSVFGTEDTYIYIQDI